MRDSEAFNKYGKFLISPEREVFGELQLAGKDTTLYLLDNKDIDSEAVSDGCKKWFREIGQGYKWVLLKRG